MVAKFLGGAGAGGVAIKFFAGPGGKRGGEYLRGATAGKRGGELRGRAYAEPGGRRRGQSSRQGQGGVAANFFPEAPRARVAESSSGRGSDWARAGRALQRNYLAGLGGTRGSEHFGRGLGGGVAANFSRGIWVGCLGLRQHSIF